MAHHKAYPAVLDAPDWTILGTSVIAVLILIVMTKGRLGKPQSSLVLPHDWLPTLH